jgi:cell division protein FtsW
MVAIRDNKPPKTDLVLLGLVLALTCIGILMVFDASYAYALQRHISQYKYLEQQAGWGVVGLLVLLVVMNWPYWKWRSLAIFGIALSALLLGAVFIPHIGIEAKGAHRWVGHGVFRLQPSELAKLAVVLYIARVCAGKTRLMKDFWAGPFPPLCVVAVLAVLIAREPDLGTALVIFFTGLAVLIFAGMKLRHVFGVVAFISCVLAIWLMADMVRHHGTSYQWSRITVFLHPERDTEGEGYQIYHSMIALGSGGLLGDGIGEGREKSYLPEAHTDFIFSVLGEEGGFVAAVLILFLYALLVGRGLQIAYNTKDPFGALLAAGISAWIGIQSLINVGVVTASIPATGVPLPLTSYGGSSSVLTLVAVGILLNIARHPEGDPSKKEDRSLEKQAREFDRRWDRHAAPSGAKSASRSPSRQPVSTR